MISEKSDLPPRPASKDRQIFFDPTEVKRVYTSFLPPLFESVCSFLLRNVGAHLPDTYLHELEKPYGDNNRPQLVTGAELMNIARPLMEAKRVAIPEGKIPLGFTHPHTRRIYMVTDTIPTHLTEEIYGLGTKEDRKEGIESVGRRTLVEEMIHRVQDLEKIGAIGEYAAAHYVRKYYDRNNLRPFLFSPTDNAMADTYEVMCRKIGFQPVESICFGTFRGQPLNKAIINLLFNLDAEKLMRERSDHRLAVTVTSGY